MATQLNKETVSGRVEELTATLKAEGAAATLIAIAVPTGESCGCKNPDCKSGIVMSVDFDGARQDLFEIIRKFFSALPVDEQMYLASRMMSHAVAEQLKAGKVQIKFENLPTPGGLPN